MGTYGPVEYLLHHVGAWLLRACDLRAHGVLGRPAAPGMSDRRAPVASEPSSESPAGDRCSEYRPTLGRPKLASAAYTDVRIPKPAFGLPTLGRLRTVERVAGRRTPRKKLHSYKVTELHSYKISKLQGYTDTETQTETERLTGDKTFCR